MPVADILEKDLISYVDRPLYELVVENKSDVPKFQTIIREIIFKIHGEVDRDINNKLINQSNYITSFNTVVSKVNFFLKSRFYENEAGVHYRYDKLDLIINPSGRDIFQYAYFIYDNCIDLRSYFIQQQSDYEKLFQLSPKTLPLTKKKNKVKRSPLRESFEIKIGKTVNLRAVHAFLTNKDHPFIDTDTPYVVFENVFSGAPVRIKVNWKYKNALHHFIDRIHGIGIEKANQGQWVCASRCFTVNGKEFTPDSIKDDDDIAASSTLILNKAIRLFL
jgi:hypothetical protein